MSMYKSQLYQSGTDIFYYPLQAKQNYLTLLNKNNDHFTHDHHKYNAKQFRVNDGPKSHKQLQMLHGKLKNKNLSHPGYKTRHPNNVFEEDIELVYEGRNGKGSIYVGNLQAAQNTQTLKRLKIGGLLTACKGIHIRHPDHLVPHYLYIPGEDHELYNIDSYFAQTISFIKKTVQQTNILVHCMAGISRSVSLVLAYLMKEEGLKFQQAYDQVKSRRRIVIINLNPQINPNKGFIRQLQNFERTLTQVLKDQNQNKFHRSQSSIRNPEMYRGNTIDYDQYQQRCKSPEPYRKKRQSFGNQFQTNQNASFQKPLPQGKNLHSRSVYLNFKTSGLGYNDAYETNQNDRYAMSNINGKRNSEQKTTNFAKNSDIAKQQQKNSHFESKTSSSNLLSNYKQYNDLNKQLQQKIKAIKSKYQEYTKQLSQNRQKKTHPVTNQYVQNYHYGNQYQKSANEYENGYKTDGKPLHAHNRSLNNLDRKATASLFNSQNYFIEEKLGKNSKNSDKNQNYLIKNIRQNVPSTSSSENYYLMINKSTFKDDNQTKAGYNNFKNLKSPYMHHQHSELKRRMVIDLQKLKSLQQPMRGSKPVYNDLQSRIAARQHSYTGKPDAYFSQKDFYLTRNQRY